MKQLEKCGCAKLHKISYKMNKLDEIQNACVMTHRS